METLSYGSVRWKPLVWVGLGWKETKQRTYSRMEGNKTMHLKNELFLNHTYTHSLLPTGARRCKVWRGGARCVETAARLECRQVNIVCYLFFTNHWSESSSFDQTISSTRSRHVSLKPFTLYEKTSAICSTWCLSEVVLNGRRIPISCLPKISGLFLESTEYEQMKFRLRLRVRHSVCLAVLNKGGDIFFLVFNAR